MQSQDWRPRAREGRGKVCPGLRRELLIQSMFQTPQHCQLHTTEAAPHLITAYANTSSQWSTVTVSPYSFTTWRRRLDVKLELLGYNLPATPHLTAGTRKCPLKFPDQLPGKHPPSLPANRLTPSSLKSHCSGGCWLVLGHTVSFTLKLTGFGMFEFSS